MRMVWSLEDTIVAIATPPGVGALGVVRLSGNRAFEVASRVLKRPSGGSYSLADLPLRTVHYAFLVDPRSGEVLDEVLFSLFKAPRSYTAQDMVEVTCHGGPLILERALEAFIEAGARLARPGEFTMRAFLLGRMDLAQAEAVADLIESLSEEGRKAAMDQLKGRLSRRLEAVAQRLRGVLVELEASIDFPEEGLEPSGSLKGEVEDALDEVERLLATYKEGRIKREGIRVAIVGLPNVGKSSLFNALVGEERAIVTKQPGTTRDVVEARVVLKGRLFLFMDTAGFRSSGDEAEEEGVKRAMRAMEGADLVLLVLDGSRPLEAGDRDLLEKLGKEDLVVVNKVDLPLKWQPQSLSRDVIPVSAKRGDGLEELKEALVAGVFGRVSGDEGGVFITNARHYQALTRTREALIRCLKAWEEGLGADFLASDVRDGLAALGEITGETAAEDVLDAIFSRFCIGK